LSYTASLGSVGQGGFGRGRDLGEDRRTIKGFGRADYAALLWGVQKNLFAGAKNLLDFGFEE
jgi:hypothetical protein